MTLPSDEKLPVHLAIIMDGNGRWAKQRMMRRIVGHRQGVETVRAIVEECSKIGIRYLTLYAFSSENWARPKSEVAALMSLLKRFIVTEIPRMMKNNIRFNVIGNIHELPSDVRKEIDTALSKTSSNNGLTLTLALSYGSRQELINAFNNIISESVEACKPPEKITIEKFSDYLYTKNLPDPDLLIRTSGEIRISNFLLWQLAYSELYFCDVNWPEFSIEHLHQALKDFRQRERRFGKTGEQIAEGRKP